MAVVNVSEDNRVIRGEEEVSKFLAQFDIWFRHFDTGAALEPQCTDDEILAAFERPIQEQMDSGGYTTADVVNLEPPIPGLDAMLARFSSEHWHSEDEVRFIVEGSGLFHINPGNAPVFAIEVYAGDMINVPKGVHHWFDLCADKRIRCVRLFKDATGWTPHYTDSGEEARHEPVCMGPTFIPPRGR